MSSNRDFTQTLVAPWGFSRRNKLTNTSAPPQSFSILNVVQFASQSFKESWMHEIIGFSLCCIVFIWGAVWTASFWSSTYFSPVQTAVQAECLVLDSRQVASIYSLGMDREPLYRAEVSVYVFASAAKPANCTSNASSNSMLGGPSDLSLTACDASNGWVGTAFDDVSGIYSSGDKSGFLRAFGQSGTYYPCWHTHDRTLVLLVRDLRTVMVLPPLLSGLAALAALARVAILIQAAAASPSAVAVEEHSEEAGTAMLQVTVAGEWEESELVLSHRFRKHELF